MKRIMRLILFGSFALTGCGQTTSLGRLMLADSDEVRIRAKISSKHWPNRRIFFSPSARGEARMPSYSEPIYSSRVRIEITNIGSDEFRVTYRDKDITVDPNGGISVPEMNFKDVHLAIWPKTGTAAHVEFNIRFDRRYNTDSWSIFSAWSDGP